MSTTSATIRTLAHGDFVRAEGWSAFPYALCTAEVFTVRGYAAGCGTDPDAEEQRATSLGHALASTIFAGMALVEDRVTRERMAAEQKRRREVCITLADGDEVEIEGRRYRVSINRWNQSRPENSDPIHFIPCA